MLQHPDVVKRVLNALLQAEDFLALHPGQAKATVRKRLSYDEAYLDSVWPDNQFYLSLDQSLIVAMEDEARWMIGRGLTKEKTVPNFLDYVYEDGLKAVKPSAVNIIR